MYIFQRQWWLDFLHYMKVDEKNVVWSREPSSFKIWNYKFRSCYGWSI